MLVHSHPYDPDIGPSEGDLKGAIDRCLDRPYVIYGMQTETLGVFKLHEDRETYTELARFPYTRPA